MLIYTWRFHLQAIMPNRKISFVEGEYYHIYNRGVDKRSVINSSVDVDRFMKSICEFNVVEPIGSIYKHSFIREKNISERKLVDIISYCLIYNHYHFILTPLVEKGIEKFMHRLGTGYTRYFNEKYKRTGALFSGVFKSCHVNSNEYLLHLSAYVNLNYRLHQFGGETSKSISKSSWQEYTGRSKENICNKCIILGQFNTAQEYSGFALSSLQDIQLRKMQEKELEEILLE